MARARNIKPGLFQNDTLGELCPLARLAFIGMWTIADFKGCIEFRPKMMKVQLLPYDDCDIESLANSLEQARFIRYYSVQGKRYIKIVNFEKHQNPHKNERDAGSEIPDIPKDNNINELTQDGIKPDSIGTARADSGFPLPSSLIAESTKNLSVTNVTGGEPPKITDPEEIIFGYGLTMLVAAGTPDKNARSFLGGLRKGYGDAALVDKLRECAKAKPLQPVEWLAAAMPPGGANSKTPKQDNFASKNYGTEITAL